MFFTFNQNNSGGGFDFDKDEGITHNVIIEADDAKGANQRALDIGLYFEGCADGRDCSCCGDRWYPQYEDREGDEVPSIWGRPLGEPEQGAYKVTKWMEEGFETSVIYKDGRIEWHA
jgi:hypothetical protein